MPNSPDDWKEIAWNGVRFHVPPSWEVGRMGRCYLLIEDEAQPVLELKWNRIKGSFSHRNHLRRLKKQQTGKTALPFEMIDTPENWVESLDSFDARCFTWGEEAVKGIGLLLFCPVCRNAAFVQFFKPVSDAFEEISQTVLESFRDHEGDGWTRWTIYDIKALVPKEFKLDKYLFQPGRFELVFRAKGYTVSLYRWGPAAVLLRNVGLEDFVKKNLKLPDETALTTIKEERAVGWSYPASGNLTRRLLKRVRRKSGVNWLYCREYREKNRVLGIAVHGRRLPDSSVLKRMSAAYEPL